MTSILSPDRRRWLRKLDCIIILGIVDYPNAYYDGGSDTLSDTGGLFVVGNDLPFSRRLLFPFARSFFLRMTRRLLPRRRW